MNILIIEDDENKQEQIKNLVNQVINSCVISLAESYNSGLNSIIDNPPTLILLDMTMPTYDINSSEDGGRPQHYAGREILRQMDRRNIKIPVIVITQFDVFGDGPESMSREELDKQLEKDHPKNYKGTIYYNAASNTWKAELKERLIHFSGD